MCVGVCVCASLKLSSNGYLTTKQDTNTTIEGAELWLPCSCGGGVVVVVVVVRVKRVEVGL